MSAERRPTDRPTGQTTRRPIGESIKRWAKALRNEVYVLYLAARDPRTPWWAKLLAGAVAAYAMSPIDLIPDFIPVIGYLDDVILVPAGIWLSLRAIPDDVVAECRERAAERFGQP